MCVCNSGTQEARTGGPRVQGQPVLHSKFQPSLDLPPECWDSRHVNNNVWPLQGTAEEKVFIVDLR